MQCVIRMQSDGIKIDKHFPKNLGLYYMDGLGSDGSVVKGLKNINVIQVGPLYK